MTIIEYVGLLPINLYDRGKDTLKTTGFFHTKAVNRKSFSRHQERTKPDFVPSTKPNQAEFGIPV